MDKKKNGLARYAEMMKNQIPFHIAKSTQSALNKTVYNAKRNWNKNIQKKDFVVRNTLIKRLVGYEANTVANSKTVDLSSLEATFGAWKNLHGKNEGDYLAIQYGGIKRPSSGHKKVGRATKSGRNQGNYRYKVNRKASKGKFNRTFESPKGNMRGISGTKFAPKTAKGRKNAYRAHFWRTIKKNPKQLFILKSKSGKKYAYRIKAPKTSTRFKNSKKKASFEAIYNVDKSSYKVKRTPWMEHSYERAYRKQQVYFNDKLSKELKVAAIKNGFK